MSVGLLDVNVLVALFDPEHLHHDAAHEWLKGNRELGWATCPMTENGLVRVLSNPGYRREPPAATEVLASLAAFRGSGGHEFWPDDVSLCDPSALDPRVVVTGRQITDLYLVALAVRHGGRLVTFDLSIALHAVAGAVKRHVCLVRG